MYSDSSVSPTDPSADPLDQATRDTANILRLSQYCIALTGAGISAESGVPTFRGKDGLWTKHGEPPLNQYQRFLEDPRAWWGTVKQRFEQPDELSLGLQEAVPNDGHFAMVELERMAILKHTITQNVDNLHRLAGSERLTEVHGNRALLRCTQCNTRAPFDDLPEALPPRCDRCGGLVKTDTVMFGEPIPPDILATCLTEARRADCMLLVGTTALVTPAADFAWEVHSRGHPMIEINPEPTVISDACVVQIRAAAGEAIPRVVARLKQERGDTTSPPLIEERAASKIGAS